MKIRFGFEEEFKLPYFEIVPRLYSEDFRWVEVNLWINWDSKGSYMMKIHTKFPLTFHTWRICFKGFPGTLLVIWK